MLETITNPKRYTEQELFDKIATHLLTQNEQALSEGDCSYRGAHGLMCAVGCVIPDEVYDPTMEGTGVSRMLEAFGNKLPELTPHEDLLSALQGVHDCYDPTQWCHRLRDTAVAFGLTMVPAPMAVPAP